MAEFDPERITGYFFGGGLAIGGMAEARRFEAAGRAQFAHRLLEVAVDRVVRDAELAPDLLGPQTVEHEAQALALAFGQRFTRVVVRVSLHLS
ncbi:MAG: hypothetical protein ABI810_14100 [Sphingomonas bacterium]